MTHNLDQHDLLTTFERESLREPYKEYYMARRNNLFASIQRFRPIWDCFMMANDMWLRDFEGTRRTTDTLKMFPLTLFMTAHAKILVTLELGFSGCMAEAYSICRDAIESVAHAHRMLTDAALQKIWLQRNDGEAGKKAFKKQFWDSKEDRLFNGLPELHALWKQFSDWGSHTNIDSVAPRFKVLETPADMEFRINYTDLPEDQWALALGEILHACELMESLFYKDYEDRLKLDDNLVTMRHGFRSQSDKVRRAIVKRYITV